MISPELPAFVDQLGRFYFDCSFVRKMLSRGQTDQDTNLPKEELTESQMDRSGDWWKRRDSNPPSALKTLNSLILRMPAIQAMPRLPDLPYKSRTKISQNSRTSKPLLRSPNTPKCSSTFIHRSGAGGIHPHCDH